MSEVMLKEKTLSWALYHPINQDFLLKLLSEISNQQLDKIIPIGRELPVLLDMKSDYTIAGYTSGGGVHFIDLLVYGKTSSIDYLFIIEVKNRAPKQSPKQAMKYFAGLLTTLNSEAHNPRGNIFQFYIEQVFRAKSLEKIVKRIQTGTGKALKIIPLILSEQISHSNYDSNVNFTYGLRKLAQERNILIPTTAKVVKLSEPRVLVRRLSKKRANDIVELYDNDPSFRKSAEQVKLLNKVIKFSTTENGVSKFFLLPKGIIKIESPSRAVRHEYEWTPLRVLDKLVSASEGNFYIQFFLNGTNNPVYYLQVETNTYFAFQHRDPFLFQFNGSFNEYIARDAKPLTPIPEAGDVITLAHGKFKIEKDFDLKGLACVLCFYPKYYYSDINIPKSFQTVLLSPKTKKARITNHVRPFLSNKIANVALSKKKYEKEIFDYTEYSIPIIHSGIRFLT